MLGKARLPIFILTLALVSHLSQCEGLSSDLCEMLYENAGGDSVTNDLAVAEIRKHIFHSYLPKAGSHAGKFSKLKNTNGWEECVSECCGQVDCDVVLYTDEKCFHISCDSEDACQPVKNSSPRHNSTVMVLVRDAPFLHPERSEPTTTTTTTTTAKPTTTTLPPSSTATSPPSGTEHKVVGDTCSYGLLECGTNAECQTRPDSKSRQGHCRCREGYIEDDAKLCVREGLPKTDGVQESRDNENDENKDANVTPQPPKSTTLPPVTTLTVSAGSDKTIQLPENSITLTAFVVPKPDEGETYHYEWSPVQVPENAGSASMDGKDTETLKLSNLVAGLYVLKIKVTGQNKLGEALINVTVLPAKRQNKPPHAIINPPSQEVQLPNSAILDGQGSTDDDNIVSYKWEEVSGPLQSHELNSNGKLLNLVGLTPGNYTFRLTVIDSDGASNSTSANVTVKKEKDYPPKADAGSNVVIQLPKNSAILYGNSSSDDNGELTYEWMKTADDKLTADMTGVRTPFLQLSNLQQGNYMFTLKVTDSAGQSDTADVRVVVQPESNHPPEAKTAGQLHLELPLESLALDGTNSTDDLGQLEYAWSQEGGPSTLTITNADKAVAIATGGITKGDYVFQLKVKDSDGLESTDKLTVTVKEKPKNMAPKAIAGGNKVLQFPVSLVTLDGSKSYDDRAITSYLWKRDSKSLAAGTVVNNSDHAAVLQLVNMVAGHYLFSLTVTDAEGLSSSDSTSVLINKNPHEKDFVEMILDANINRFTVANQESLVDQLELLLQKSSEDRDVVVEFISVTEDVSTGHLCLTFQVIRRNKESRTIMNGVQALRTLKNKMSSGKILDYSIVRLDLSVCQNNCSGHGHCDQKTKQCVCEAFWMPNFFTSSLFSTDSNCDWSVLYVVIICFIILVAFISTIWAVICCCTSKSCDTPCCLASKKCKMKLKGRRRHRYSLLRNVDNDSDKEKLEMMTKGKIQNSSVMISESDLSSDEETLFVSNKKAHNGLNGKVTNGSRPSYKNKLKT